MKSNNKIVERFIQSKDNNGEGLTPQYLLDAAKEKSLGGIISFLLKEVESKQKNTQL